MQHKIVLSTFLLCLFVAKPTSAEITHTEWNDSLGYKPLSGFSLEVTWYSQNGGRWGSTVECTVYKNGGGAVGSGSSYLHRGVNHISVSVPRGVWGKSNSRVSCKEYIARAPAPPKTLREELREGWENLRDKFK